MNLNLWRDILHTTAKEKGWWEQEDITATVGVHPQQRVLIPPNIPEKLALIHSEISEALEDYRSDIGDYIQYTHSEPPQPFGFAVELADAIIRILDLCGYLNIDIEKAVREKAEYNRTRPYRHGGKKA